ncbi:MbcA/ParS/Xre antitoxin family protein [Mycobacteroides chelonae]|uniref:MbcA/ParS/Xre antitoxin family protein n=1 Tax=Mycobacteroides chelonae TaxID=1774 RepID=UPI000A45DEB8|nr:MbcA/ParS/Xre antitoxin family protein [Mycobacteroides chelonae]
MATKKAASGRARSRHDERRRAHKSRAASEVADECANLQEFERAADNAAAAPRKAPAARPTARVAADDPLSTHRVEYLASIFTRAQLARWIGVSPSQTSRWASGVERPGPAAAPALIDLEHVYSRARLVWGEEAARIWLESANAFLGGGRPLDVLLTDGPARVLEALDAEMWGGAA